MGNVLCPVACAAALATIDYIETHDLIAHFRELGRYALDRIKIMKKKHPLIGVVRGIGLFLGIELTRDGQHALEEAKQVMYNALSKGSSFKPTMGNIITLTPALTITKEEMDQALDTIESCIAEVEAGTCSGPINKIGSALLQPGRPGIAFIQTKASGL